MFKLAVFMEIHILLVLKKGSIHEKIFNRAIPVKIA